MTSTLLQLIDKKAADNPNSAAVRWQRQTLSYDELVSGSVRIARGLASRGIGPKSRVGISLGRDLDLAVGLLGIYRSGAAYVPLDPIYPTDRLNAMVRKAEIDLVLADAQCPISSSDRVPFTSFDELQPEKSTVGAPEPATSTSGYVIFTSGSTGTPKGVELGRSALENLIHWQTSQPRLGQPTQVLQFTPTSFDVHFQEFFGTWVAGGTLVLVDDATRRDPQQLASFLAQESIGRLFLPFVALRQLADVVMHAHVALPNLRDVVTAGEQLVVTDNLRRMFQALPDCRLHNHYGPSETHVATAYELSSVASEWEKLPSIGVPIANVVAEVRSDSGATVADDEVGELYLGGACLAQGYVGEPDLTSERFVLLPDAPNLFYRTGDLVRRDVKGNLYYQGRADNQIKIRGYRVEVGEVEAQLNQDNAIRDCAVVAQETLGGNKRLIAYLVLEVKPTEQKLASDTAIDQWRQVWEHTYSKGQQSDGPVIKLNPEIDPKFDIRGWNSSYTGDPLGEATMREWVQGTRDRILALKPKRLLEIGAGTGLLLFAVAPAVSHYQALDYSATAIHQLQAALRLEPSAFAHCHAMCGTAHDLGSLAANQYDTIVINSVTQHFESSRYLELVLQQAVDLLRAGGSLFLGDITAKRTREWFFAGVEGARGGTDLDDQALRRRVTKRLSEERELTLDAEFFYSWAQHQPRIESVSVQLKPGSADSELANFRYDVTLKIRPEGAEANESKSASLNANVALEHWSTYDSLNSLQVVLAERANSAGWALRIEGIPNARLQSGKVHWQRVTGEENSAIESVAASSGLGNAVQPDAILKIATELRLTVQTVFSGQGEFTAIFASTPLPSSALLSLEQRHQEAETFASRPYLAGAFPDIVKRVRRTLESRLPEYMLPARYVLLQALPITPSGKLDRLRLPEPNSERPDLPESFVAAASELEQQLAVIWQEVLELDQVGVLDNFFDLGGTSILSLQLVNEISSQLQTNVSIVQLFESPTIRTLCKAITQTTKNAAGVNKAQQRARKQQQVLAKTRALRNKSRTR